MTNKLLGIDLNPNAIKLVELSKKDEAFSVLKWSINYTADAPSDTPQKILTSALKKNKISARSAYLALSGSEVSYKIISLPPMPDKEISLAMSNKLEGALGIMPDEVFFDYYALSGMWQGEQQLYFVVIVPRERVLSSIALTKKAGLALVDIIPSAIALKNAAKLSNSGAYALIHLGKYSTVVILVKSGQLVFARDIKVGGENIVSSMVGVVMTPNGKLEVNEAKAAEIVEKYGVPIDEDAYTKESNLPSVSIMAMMRPALEKIGAEILRTFDYFRQETGDETEFGHAYFTGEASLMRGLLDYYKEKLNIEVEVLPAVNISSAPPAFKDVESSLIRALGAPLPGNNVLSLLPDEYKHPLRTQLKKLLNFWTVGLVYILILALIWTWFFIKDARISSRFNMLEQRLKAAGINLKPFSESEKALKVLLAQEKNTENFVEVMAQLESLTPQSIYFTNLGYSRKTRELSITGVAVSSAADITVSNFIDNLNKSGNFSSINLAYLEESDEFAQAFNFNIKCVLKGD
ncbi:MAG: pilus assembly protein PilM [Candidatus Saganbacteria bacterium]|nr:pilus assembly protein PilM [Candidatus Saganbacteria bacterium]